MKKDFCSICGEYLTDDMHDRVGEPRHHAFSVVGEPDYKLRYEITLKKLKEITERSI